MGYRKTQDTYYYSTVSFKGMYKLLKYLDTYSLQYQACYLAYVFVRKSYLLVQDKQHLTSKGLKKIFKYRDSLSKIR